MSWEIGWRCRVDARPCSAVPSRVSDEAPVPPSAPTTSSSAAASALSSSPSFPFSLLSLGSGAQRMATKWWQVMDDR